ncbi:MAG TPA: NAD(P)-binding domain-containing protein [Pseudolabrys sp.]|nr:NAD(P)-binding domain-containing protein [Pseudolabrys sp.]
MSHDACEVAIVGAGPYGLSISTHLRAAGVSNRVFGDTMGFWRKNMPNGMKLRSPWRASHIIDPAREHSLDVFADAHGIAHVENLPLKDFVRYGEWFQRRAVPDVDPRMVRSIASSRNGFQLRLEDGGAVDALRVVVAMGLTNQAFIPDEFRGLPADLLSHSSAVIAPADFRGKKVAVVGRGQSACESAVLLNEAGAEVELICRGPVHWIGAEASQQGRSEILKWWIHKVMTAPSAVGPFPYNWAVDVPSILRVLPAGFRDALSKRSLRPAASAWLRARAGGVHMNAGRIVREARVSGSRAALQFEGGFSEFDHVVAATGYKTDLAKLNVLAPELLEGIALRGNFPVLSRGFESSIPGLHFVGSPAVGSFGPLPRFVAGCGYAARSVTRAVRGRALPLPVAAVPQAAMQPQQ